MARSGFLGRFSRRAAGSHAACTKSAPGKFSRASTLRTRAPASPASRSRAPRYARSVFTAWRAPHGRHRPAGRTREVPGCTSMLAAVGYAPVFSIERHTVFAPVEHHVPHPFGEHARQPSQDRAAHSHRRESARRLQSTSRHRSWPRDRASRHQRLCVPRRTVLPYAAAHGWQHARECTSLHAALSISRGSGGGFTPEEWRDCGVHRDSAERLVDLSGRCHWPRVSVPGSIPPDVLAAFRAVCPATAAARATPRPRTKCPGPTSHPGTAGLRVGAHAARAPAICAAAACCRNATRWQELADGHACAAGVYAAALVQPVSHANAFSAGSFSRPPRVQTIATVLAGQTRQ